LAKEKQKSLRYRNRFLARVRRRYFRRRQATTDNTSALAGYVRRGKVIWALHWLVQHNPVYKDITIDYELLALLPSDGIPTELRKIDCTENSKDEIDPDRGPLDEIHFNEDTELNSTILNPVQLKPQKQLITDELLQNHKVNWPHRNSSPLNEFKIEYLATMVFPTLFPDGEGDPTNSARMRDVTLGDKIKHLIKFAEYNNGKWTYRFANHPRFAYWAFNMIQRHILFSQGNIFLKQNTGGAKLTVEQLQQMLQSNTYSTLMSRLMHYAKNVTGSNSYWHKAKEDLRATIAQVGPPTIFFSLYLVLTTIGLNFMNFFVTLTLNTLNQQSGSKMFLKIHISWIGFLLSEQIVLSNFD